MKGSKLGITALEEEEWIDSERNIYPDSRIHEVYIE
jgi:hypothetical protein